KAENQFDLRRVAAKNNARQITSREIAYHHDWHGNPNYSWNHHQKIAGKQIRPPLTQTHIQSWKRRRGNRRADQKHRRGLHRIGVVVIAYETLAQVAGDIEI